MKARAPASSANLGPGFDAIAVALALYVEVSVEPADRLRVTASGHGADLPCDASHLAARIACEVAGTDRLAVDVRSDIPVGRGLGSSAAVAVAAAAAAGSADPMRWGVEADGHPENAAASALGGLVAATTVGDDTLAVRHPLDPGLAFVLLVPDLAVATLHARQALPLEVPLVDATFNLGRLGVLLAALADRRHLVPALTDDRLHQDARSIGLHPDAPRLLDGLVAAGARASCWSGAGPSLLALCDAGAAAQRVRDAGADLLADVGMAGCALVLEADTNGVVVGP